MSSSGRGRFGDAFFPSQNRECQAAHWSAHKTHCKSIPLSPEELQLHFTVGRSSERITFHENMPAAFCRRDAPRDLTSRWVSNLVKTHEEEVLERHPNSLCVYCFKPAIKLHTTITLTLHTSPPTVFVLCQPVCTKNRNDACAMQAQETIDRGMADPNFPTGGEIYRM
jgi:hypothetical protein